MVLTIILTRLLIRILKVCPAIGFLLEPHEFKATVEAIYTVEKTLGEVHYVVGEWGAKSRVIQQSLSRT